MSVTKLATRYAKALLDLSKEKSNVETVYKNVNEFSNTVKSNRDLYRLLKSPIINPDKKQAVLKRIFGNSFDPMTNSFFDIIVRKRREAYLPEIADEFVQQYKDSKSIVGAKLITATAVDDTLLKTVRSIVMEHTNCKEVELEISTDPTILGGFILQFRDKLYDASLMGKLDELDKQFQENEYIKKY